MIKSFFIFLLTPLLFLSSLGFVVYRMQDPSFVVDQSRSVNLYGRLADNIGKFLPTDQIESFGFEAIDVTEVLKSGIDGEEFYKFESSALSAYLPWLTGKTGSLQFSYDLQGVRQKITETTEAKILAKYNSSPVCTPGQLRDWSFDEGLPSCQLPNGTLKAKSITNLSHQAAAKLTEGIPDAISASQTTSQLQTIRTNVAQVFRVIQVIWVITLLLLGVYLLLFRTSGLISLAISFLMVGLLQIGFSLIGWDWITKTISEFVAGKGEAKSIAPIIIDLASVILGAMKTVMGNISVGFLSAGSVLIIIGLIKKFHQPKVGERT